MSKHNVDHIEKQLKSLDGNLKKLADDQSITELLGLIRRPGHTTPAEISLTAGIVDSLGAQVESLIRLKQNLLEGSRLVVIDKVGSAAGRA